MKTNWTKIKEIIGDFPHRQDLYLSIIDEDGLITRANARMLKSLSLGDPRSVRTNFLDLLHPGHIDNFKDVIQHAAQQNGAAAMELYIKNGSYHPMKWQVNLVDHTPSKKIFFCLGYTIIDDDRLKQFNRLAEKHHQLIADGLTGIVFHDKSGDIIAANQQVAQLLHTSLERIYQLRDIGQLWESKWKVINEEGELVPFENSPFMKALRTGKAQKEMLYMPIGIGEGRWILFNSQPLPDDHCGRCCCVISNIIDVTNERLLVQNIEEKTSLVDAFVKRTPNLCWVIDEEHRLIRASSAFYRYFGLDEITSLNKKMSELVQPVVFNTLFEKHKKVFDTGESIKATERIRLADGSNYVSHINIFRIDSNKGRKLVGGYAVNLPDTTKIEAELREANQRLLTLTRAVSNAIWEWDMQTGIIFRNDVLMKMIGYQADDSKGLSWWLRRIHPEDRNRVSDKVKEATDNNRYSWQDEYRFKCADGNYKHIQDKGFVIYENGLPVKMIGSLHDISDLKELENKLENEKLQRQKEISETVIQVQERERTRLGHELHDNVNQVLSTALLFVDMLAPEGKEQKQIKDKSLDYIKFAIEEIRKLSRELVAPRFREQGLIESIRSLIEDIHMAHTIRINFEHDIDEELLSSGKKITLFRIVQEQMKNILKYSKAKNAEIALRMVGADVEMTIKDNGIGFDLQQTHRGIGLSNIYERVSFYNGMVDIRTAKGKGCAIVVRLSS